VLSPSPEPLRPRSDSLANARHCIPADRVFLKGCRYRARV